MSDETEETTAVLQMSEGGVDKVDLLPPPNMNYLTRKSWVPLKWTRSNTCSGFVLEDNTVVFIGTRKYEDAIRQSFLDSLRGCEGDLDDYIESTCAGALKEECSPETVIDETMPVVLPKSTTRISTRLLNDSDTAVLPKSIPRTSTILLNDSDTALPSKQLSLVDHKVKDVHRLDPVGDSPYMRISSDKDLSSSSEDEDLPRVKVTGRPVPVQQQHEGTGSGNLCSRAMVETESGNTGLRQTMSNTSSSGEAAKCEGSSEFTLLKCPICNISLPLRYLP